VISELAERILLTAAGPLIGSCLGLLSLRLPAGEPVGVARSRCAGCGRKLGPLDLVPILSWVASRGRCRSCAAPIPLRYPLIEAGCAVIGLWAALAFDGPLALATGVFGWALLLIAILDAEHFWLPHRLTVPLMAGGLIVAATLQTDALIARTLGVVAGWAFLAGLAWGYRRLRGRDGLGGGDPMMLGAVGAWVGWQGLPTVLLLSAGFGLATALVQGRLRADARLPFGTLMAVAAWLIWLYGPAGG
jgi:leader peptidase (prepilin peptidase) / N-methyltransferase